MSIRVILPVLGKDGDKLLVRWSSIDPDLDLVAVGSFLSLSQNGRVSPVFKDKVDLVGFEADVCRLYYTSRCL